MRKIPTVKFDPKLPVLSAGSRQVASNLRAPAVDVQNVKESESANLLHLTARFTRAIDYARQLHVNYRKGTSVPYMAHLIGVAALVMGESGYVGFPVTEDMVIGALLRDAVGNVGRLPRLRDIEANFGKEVARIVEGCTDSFEEDSGKK
jgi:(p)ppGpp synthase/HD superfamily hydrolase